LLLRSIPSSLSLETSTGRRRQLVLYQNRTDSGSKESGGER
jgi:hypothetical protein